MPYPIFHIVLPLTIVDGAQLEIVVFPFALLHTGDPLTFVIVAIDKVHGAGAMRQTIEFLPIVYIFFLNYLLCGVVIVYFLLVGNSVGCLSL